MTVRPKAKTRVRSVGLGGSPRAPGCDWPFEVVAPGCR